MIGTVPGKGHPWPCCLPSIHGRSRVFPDLAAFLQLLSQNPSIIFSFSVLSDESRGPWHFPLFCCPINRDPQSSSPALNKSSKQNAQIAFHSLLSKMLHFSEGRLSWASSNYSQQGSWARFFSSLT